MEILDSIKEFNRFINKISKAKVRSWILGLVILIVLLFYQVNLDFIVFSDDYKQIPDSTFNSEITIRGIPKHASYDMFTQSQSFEVDFDHSMRVNETKKFTLTFDRWITYVPASGSYNDYLSQLAYDESKKFQDIEKEMKFKLFSSGFEIEPDKVLKGKDKAPFTLFWTLRAKSEGNHKLILDLSDVIFEEEEFGGGFFSEDFVINGKKYEIDQGIVEFDTNVYTIWNIKKWHFELIRYFIALIAFILMYPLVSDFVKTKFRVNLKSEIKGNSGINEKQAGKNSRIKTSSVEMKTDSDPGKVSKKTKKTTHNKH